MQIYNAVKKCEPSAQEIGTVGIRNEFVSFLKAKGWATDRRQKNALDHDLRYFDAVLPGSEKPSVVKWGTGDISSLHRSMNKLTMLVSSGMVSA